MKPPKTAENGKLFAEITILCVKRLTNAPDWKGQQNASLLERFQVIYLTNRIAIL